jgi:hypothetical protein
MLHAGREAFPDLGFVSESGLIDPNYYLINGSDVHEAELDPADHFCRYGWREGRKPNIYFDRASCRNIGSFTGGTDSLLM